jgi:hypothetical protein
MAARTELMDGNQELADGVRRPGTSRIYRRSAGLALLAATAAAVLAGCGGSTSPSVANIATASTQTTAAGTSGRGSSTSTGTRGNATGFLVEWAACMRSRGDPQQTDPTVDDHWGINVTIPLSAPESLSNEVHGGTAPCDQYLAAASSTPLHNIPHRRSDAGEDSEALCLSRQQLDVCPSAEPKRQGTGVIEHRRG